MVGKGLLQREAITYMVDMGKKPSVLGGQPAKLGGLSSEIRHDLLIFRDFMFLRERALTEMVGGPKNRSQLRESVIRQIVLAYTEGRIQRVSDYQKLCSRFGSAPSIRTEISRLEAKKVVALRPDPTDRRAIEVWPTERLIAWYRETIPVLINEISRLVKPCQGNDT